ncbi:MAG: hypothetical protein AAB864_02490 [Patescibacteria group bacterium]
MRRFIATSCLIAIVTGFLIPAPTSAATIPGVPQKITDAAQCVGASWIASKIQNFIKKKLRKLAKRKIDRAINSLIGTKVPVEDAAAIDELQDILNDTTTLREKEEIWDLVARCAARTFFDNEVTRILFAARRGGREGGPAYVRNWRNFQTNAEYRGEAVFRAILSNTKLCDYLSKDLKNTFHVQPKDKLSLKNQNIRVGDFDPFTLRAKCTLPQNFDIAKYQKDFTGNGGWAVFERLLQPQNNPYGLALAALSEVNKQRALEVSADLNEARTGQGFLATRGSPQASCKQRNASGRCVFFADIKSPSGYVAASVGATINQELAWLTNADELNEVLVRVITRLSDRFIDFSKEEEYPSYVNDPQVPTGDLDEDGSPGPTPTGSPGPTSCTGGNPACTCVKDDPAYEKYGNGVSAAEDRAIEQRPDLFEIGGRGEIRLRPGASPETARDVICGAFAMAGVTLCRAHAQGLEDELVLEVTAPREDVSIDFLVSDGSLWANPIAACEPGVQ